MSQIPFTASVFNFDNRQGFVSFMLNFFLKLLCSLDSPIDFSLKKLIHFSDFSSLAHQQSFINFRLPHFLAYLISYDNHFLP